MLEDGKIPQEIELAYQCGGSWTAFYWGGDSWHDDIIGPTGGLGITIPVGSCFYNGEVPHVTGNWLQLVSSTSYIQSQGQITGIYYALYGGAAKWDFSATNTEGEIVDGLTSGMTVKLIFNGRCICSATASSSSVILQTGQTIMGGVYPQAATLQILSGNTLIYTSPIISGIYNGDRFTYHAWIYFYPNIIKDSIHDRVVGTFTHNQELTIYSDVQEFMKYDFEGNQIETKSLDRDWIYSQKGYDIYGNQIISRDGTGRTVYTEYSSSDQFTYPVATRNDGRMDNFDWETAWTQTRSFSGDSSWFVSDYTSTKSYSPKRSVQESYSGAGANGYDYGGASLYREFYTNDVSRISLRMFVDQYSHDGSTWDLLDSGVRLRIYDSNGVNYANYTYWLACWYQGNNNRTTTDPNVKVLCGMPVLNSWISRDLYPSATWDINWTRCDKVRIEIYTTCSGAAADQFRVYYDDISYLDKEAAGKDNLDSGYGWTTTLAGSGGITNWLAGGYTSTRSSSSPYSLQDAFSNGPGGYDTGVVTNYKDFSIGEVISVSLKMYVDTYSHNKDLTWDTMDSGLRIRLYDGNGTNYVSYTYWLACWYHAIDNKTASGPTVKVIWGQPPMNQWISLTFFPTKDFNINWAACSKVRFELYSYGSGAALDYFRAFFDDFSFKGGDPSIAAYSHDLRNGRVLSSTDALGRTTSQQYDVLGRVIRKNETDGSYSTVVYDDVHNRITQTDQSGHKTVTYFDGIGREIGLERDGTGSTAYSISRAFYTWQDRTSKTVDALGRITTYTYDYQGRATTTRYNDGTTSQMTYDDKNKTATSVDQNGHKIVYLYDLLGELITTREYSTATAFNATDITYDSLGNVLVYSCDDPIDQLYYDGLNRQNSIYWLDGSWEYCTLDAGGRVLNFTDRGRVVTRNAYDTDGNAIRIFGTSDKIATVYDAVGNIIETRNSLGAIDYQYDVRDRVSQVTQKINASIFSIGYIYNNDDSLSSAKYPDGRTISYLYDSYGRNVDIRYGTTKLLNVTYNKDDSIAAERYYNGSTTTAYTYNNRGFVQSIVTKDQAQVRQQDLNYTYDAKGNIATIRDALRGVTESYYYDFADRLVRATGNWNGVMTLTYTYDSYGNRLTKNEGSAVTYSYNSIKRLTGDGTYSYFYDRAGNLIWKNCTGTNVQIKYTYDSFGHMTRADKYVNSVYNSNLGMYFYDANGARAKTIESGVTNCFVYAGASPILQVGPDGKSNKYLYLGSKLELRQIDGSNSYVYITDALGSVRKVFKNGDSTQTTFSATAYLPFGKAIVASGSDKVTFAGEMQDTSTGLFYLSARYYDPEMGRFYALDPILGDPSMPQTLERYVYCGNNPLIRTDPTGKCFGLNILLGAVIGAVVNGAVAYLNGEDVLQAAAIGAISGAIAGATLGLGVSLWAGSAAATAAGEVEAVTVSEILGNIADQGLLGAGKVAVLNFASGAASSLAGDVAKSALTGKEFDLGSSATHALISGAISAASFSGMRFISTRFSAVGDILSKPLVVGDYYTSWEWTFTKTYSTGTTEATRLLTATPTVGNVVNGFVKGFSNAGARELGM
jgi:RHS repeat-associated protein